MRRIGTLTIIAATISVMMFTPHRANAAGNDGDGVATLLIHGFDPGQSTPCRDPRTFGPLIEYLSGSHNGLAWHGDIKVIGFYAGDNCDDPDPFLSVNLSYFSAPQCDSYPNGDRSKDGTNNEPIEHIACRLAWYIHDTYTVNHVPVDIVAHSMGGVIAKWALWYTSSVAPSDRRYDPHFPPSPNVQTVITLGAPLSGIGNACATNLGAVLAAANFCDINSDTYKFDQANQLVIGSDFINKLTGLGTPDDPTAKTHWIWSLIGSNQACLLSGALHICVTGLDGLVDSSSSTGMHADYILLYHQVGSSSSSGYSHQDFGTFMGQTPFDPPYLLKDEQDSLHTTAQDCFGCGPSPSDSDLGQAHNSYGSLFIVLLQLVDSYGLSGFHPPQGPSGYTFCAPETGACSFDGFANVAYGANGKFAYQGLTNGTFCNNTVFGDPIPGTFKHCFYQVPAGPSGYTLCSPEGGSCSFSGTANVAYGANGIFTYQAFAPSQNLSTGVACNNGVFGDPTPNVFKDCFEQIVHGPRGYTFCSGEGQMCNFSGTANVVFGVNGIFNSGVFTNGVACNNNVFNDPTPGFYKDCFYQIVSPPPPPPFSDAAGWNQPQYGTTIMFGDINGDGQDDFCGRGVGGLFCELSAGGDTFGPAYLATGNYSDSDGWSQVPYYNSLRLADVRGNGRADACGRAAAGIYCSPALKNGVFAPAQFWLSSFRDVDGWNQPQYGTTIMFGDINGDGMDDVCGRGVAGIYCALSTGGGFESPILATRAFSNADGWDQLIYYGSLRLADVNGDGKADICGRGVAGIYCALSNGDGTFGQTQFWSADFSNANGWGQPQYSSTIMLRDINSDGAADVCARGAAGIWCALSTGSGFGPAFLATSAFADSGGWNNLVYYGSIRLADINGTGVIQACGRGSGGVVCVPLQVPSGGGRGCPHCQ